MVKKIICFGLKNQGYNPKIKEGQLIGVAIQTWHDYVWSSCGYLMVPNDQEAIQNLENKKLNQEHFFHLETDMRVEEFTEDIISEEGKKLGVVGKKKIYVEDPDWGQKIKLIYCHSIKCFVPKKVVRSENNLFHIEIEPMEFYIDGLIDKLIFTGEKINQYRNLITQNLGKEFKMSMPIFDSPPSIDTNKWDGKDKIELAEEKISGRPEKTIPEIKKDLNKYYQKNDIKMIKLSDEDKELMDIIFNSGKKQSSNTFSNRCDKQKLEQVKIYLKSNNKEILSYSELSASSDVNSSRNSNKENSMSGGTIVLIIVGVISVVGFFSWLIWKGKRTDAAPTTVRIRRRG